MSRPEAYVYFECRPNKKCFCGWVSMDGNALGFQMPETRT